MEIDFAILTEKAETNSRGLLQLFGGGLNKIEAPAFPALSQLSIAMRLIGEFDEAGTDHSLSLAVINPNGERIVFPDKEIQLGQTEDDRHNLPAAMVIFELVIAFAAAGPYTFQIGLDGTVAKEIRLVLRQGGVVPTMIAQAHAPQEVRQ